MKFTKSVLNKYQKLIDNNLETEFAQRRYERNVLRKDIHLSKEAFWEALVLGILTSVAPNNDSYRKDIKQLKITDYEFMKDVEDITEHVQKLKGMGLNGRVKAQSITMAMERLEKNWKELKKHLETIFKDTTLEKERSVARYVRENFYQIGLKQSRNIIQMMGLSQYVTPLDSRIVSTLKEYKGIEPIPDEKGALKAALQNESWYLGIEDQLNELCVNLGVKPCILDACAFVSKERD